MWIRNGNMSKPNPLKTTITEQLEQASFIVHRGETWQDAMEATDGPNGERRGVGDMYGEFIGKKLQGLADAALLLGDASRGLEVLAMLWKLEGIVSREVNRLNRAIDKELGESAEELASRLRVRVKVRA